MKLATFVSLLLVFAFPSIPATFTVNNSTDVVDANPGDGICETGTGNGICTLRAAVQEAGASSGANAIIVPAGTYMLSATPSCTYSLVSNPNVLSENMSALCVRGTVTITGAGPDSTIIDAGGAAGATCCGGYPSARGFVISLGSVVNISGITIQNGRSNGGYAWFGGGAINNQGSLTLSSSVLTTNIGPPGGGGIWNDGILLVDNVTFSGNSGGQYGGGGLYNNTPGTAEISNSSFNANETESDGAAIANLGTLKILAATLSNNVASGNGGGLYNAYGGYLTLTNVTIAANQAFVAGAIWNSNSATVTANNTTMAFNHATYHGGGIINSASSFTVWNTIIGGNYDDSNPSALTDCEGPVISQGHNIIQSTSSPCTISGATSSDIYGQDPALGALASNGGSTQTLALLAASPAIDAGDPSTPGTGGTACAAADQRGILRPQNQKCDIGAFESFGYLSVTGFSPAHAGNTGVVEGVISGGGIAASATVKLRRSGQPDIVGTQITVQPGSSSMAALFDLTGQVPGPWDLVATNPDGTTGVLPGALTVDSGGSAHVWAQAVGPSPVRPGTSPTFYLVFGNRGNIDALDVPVTLAMPTEIGLDLNFLVQPPPAQAGQVVTDWTQAPLYALPGPSNGFVNVPLLLPIIPAGYSGALRFKISIPGSLTEGDLFTIYASNGDPILPLGSDPKGLVNQMAAGAVDYAQANLGVTVPSSQNSSLDQYAVNQLQNAVANGRAAFAANSGGGNLVYSLGQMNIDAALFAASQITSPTATPLAKAFKPRSGGGSSQAEYQVCTVVATGKIGLLPTGSPIPEVPGGISCKDPDLYIPPPPCFPGQQPTPQVPCLQPDTQPLTPAQCRDLPGHRVNQDGTMCLPNPGQGCAKIANPLLGADPVCTPVPLTTSVDPNDKFGPFGPGAQHFHISGTSFNYNIEFQNQPTAPVPAQQVVVTDQLDTSNLDLSTFALGPISFGNYTLTPPGGAQQFSGGLDLRPDQNIIVKVDAGLNQSTGLVTWRFTSLDPDTEQLTTNPIAGFLPPDVNPPEGEGKLLYSVNPKPAIASGATVCNQATVVFDTNAPINTQTWCNTVDDIAPHSSVGALPTIESGASFPVQWSGTDTGSGINDYTIYVSDNGGSYQAWISDTTLTQSTYPGVLGHSYAFYSIASDMVGNVEASKSAPDTVTTVSNGAPVCAADVTAQFNITRGGYRYNNGTHRFQQVVTITRTAAGSLAGPFALAVEGLGINATLYSPAGTTSCIAPGSAYVNVNPGTNWSAGQSVTVTLEFVDPTMTGITYKPALLAGGTR